MTADSTSEDDRNEPYLPAGLPAPEVTTLDRPYWEAARDGRLVVQVCGTCAKPQWPPEEICSSCHSVEREWADANGKGIIFSWTRIWHAVHPALTEHGPYLVVVVKLDDYPLLMIGNLLGEPHQLVDIGMPVEVVFEDRTDGHTLVQWRHTS